MYVFAMARAINRGWLSPVAYGPAAQLGWNAVAMAGAEHAVVRYLEGINE